MEYYDENSEKFIAETLELDLSDLYKKFECYLKAGDILLDIGCGPGRDLKYFSSKYNVIGIEPSRNLAEFARNYSKCEVIESTIQECEINQRFDAIWACASLLHISKKDLVDVFKKLNKILNKEGILYCSFKEGDFEGDRNGRYFTDLTLETLTGIIKNTSFHLHESWITKDIRNENETNWLNVILKA
jgi:cyclopropane fatty-acyl-phospholipid synthase-like methyltransferase